VVWGFEVIWGFGVVWGFDDFFFCKNYFKNFTKIVLINTNIKLLFF
jgi:hypothetical protein